ncbi:MAG: electron transport complex subunit RsxC [Mariprofundales bacterium]
MLHALKDSSFRKLARRMLGGVIPLARAGVHPPMEKRTAGMPIEDASLPPLLVLPMRQHIGQPCEPIVELDAKVLRGQKLAKSKGYVSAPIHAPTSGTIVNVEQHPIVHPSGIGMMSIYLQPDGEDCWSGNLQSMADYRDRDPAEVREQVRSCGIAGLGGATFPTFIKLVRDKNHPIDTLILNGIECEPWLTCDHRLMMEQADRIVAGMEILQWLVQAKRCVVAIEDNKPDAAAAMTEALKRANVSQTEVRLLPTIYPQGSEKQLIATLTGREIAAGKLPLHVGVLCQNVGTTLAVADAVLDGRPLTERVVTLSGDAMTAPANLRVRLGTPVDWLLRRQGVEDLHDISLIQGGQMMGERIHHPESPVTKGCNGILAMRQESFAAGHVVESPCIRCGHCVQVCPAGLLPNELASHCRNDRFEEAESFSLFDCIECGACSFVCPAHIPLVHYFRYGKGQMATIRRANAFAEESRQRSEARDVRIQRDKDARAARRAKVRKPAPAPEEKGS